LFHILIGVILIWVANFFPNSFTANILKGAPNLYSLIFIYIPSAFISVYGIIFYRNKDSWEKEIDWHGIGIPHPDTLHPDNIASFLAAVLVSQFFLFTLLFLYISGFEDLKSSLLRPFGFLNWGILSLQSRIIIAN